MYVDIDGGADAVSGYKYKNISGLYEHVELNGSSVTIKDSVFGKSAIYAQDIPKLIRALQAAYDHLTTTKGN